MLKICKRFRVLGENRVEQKQYLSYKKIFTTVPHNFLCAQFFLLRSAALFFITAACCSMYADRSDILAH